MDGIWRDSILNMPTRPAHDPLLRYWGAAMRYSKVIGYMVVHPLYDLDEARQNWMYDESEDGVYPRMSEAEAALEEYEDGWVVAELRVRP